MSAWFMDVKIEGTAVRVRGEHDACPRVARLITAAPELLVACQAARPIIGEPGDYNQLAWDEAADLLQAAIEAAVGRVPEGDTRETE